MWRSILILGAVISACVSTDVGDPCTPEQVPAGGFVGSETYLETATAQCRTRTCLVHHLEGDPTLPCADPAAPGCTTPDAVAASVYCSCRCAGPPGADYCTCPTGFACTPLFEHGGAGLIGSYCVRE